MSSGVDVRVKSIRIWWKHQGKLSREKLDWTVNQENIDKAHKLATLIQYELDADCFDLARHFPNSVNLVNNQMNHYIEEWIKRYQHTVAPSSWSSYSSNIKNHIKPYWGRKDPQYITADDMDSWINDTLLPKLSSKTTREILTRWRKIWQYWARKHPEAKDPSEGITIRLPDPDDPDPFTRDEIAKILDEPTDPDLNNLWNSLLWSGLSMHELICLAITDIDLVRGVIYINRSSVRNQYRVTKTRRRKRVVQMLATTKAAIQAQIHLVQDYPAQTITLLNRDNRTKRNEKVQWLWYCHSTGSHYNYDQMKNRWRKHLTACKVRYRAVNHGRHTYASQLLTTGLVSIEWLADQLGHGSTQMIHRHYGKYITTDAPDHVQKLDKYLSQSAA